MITETDRQLRIIASELKSMNRNLEIICKILLKDKEDPNENSISEPKGL